jgi:hypothetical protein
MLSSPSGRQNDTSSADVGSMNKGDSSREMRVFVAGDAGEVAGFAAGDLADALGRMLQQPVEVERSASLHATRIAIGAHPPADKVVIAPLTGDRFEIVRSGDTLVVEAGSDRGVLHAASELLGAVGARYPQSGSPSLPAIDISQLLALAPRRVEPAFSRRAFVSDIMTWNYSYEDRLALHLSHDREFIPWMARKGINAFFYIRHAHDARLRIDELMPLYRQHGIGSEYGGHVIQILLPRAMFDAHPEYFPRGADERRNARGNLCVSNPAALELVRAGAVEYVRDYPENELLHIWGADVFGGAWCRCPDCAPMSPQEQYLKVLNAVADSLERSGPPVAYCAYHDTIEPDRTLKPRQNVWFEWAPRERCYSHTIDDPACETNPRYWDALRRYVELFEGRGHIFEYYADAILFGGLGFATPAVIARDLRAYHGLGLRSISCLTFGAYSVLAYPVNQLAFVRGTRSLEFDPDRTLADVASERHPQCAPAMASAYRAIERASKMILTYGDVMRPRKDPQIAARTGRDLIAAIAEVRIAISAADAILAGVNSSRVAAERMLWQYGMQSLESIVDYLGALTEGGERRASAGEAAIKKADAAIERIRAMQLEVKGTWGAYDLEWIHPIWIEALRRGLTPGADTDGVL